MHITSSRPAVRAFHAQEAVGCVGEEVVRGSSGAPLAQLLAALEPALRQATGGGAWQVGGLRGRGAGGGLELCTVLEALFSMGGLRPAGRSLDFFFVWVPVRVTSLRSGEEGRKRTGP